MARATQTVTVVNPEQLGLSLEAPSTSRSSSRSRSRAKPAKKAAKEVGCMPVRRDKKGRFVSSGRRKNPPNPANPKPRRRRRRRAKNPYEGGGEWIQVAPGMSVSNPRSRRRRRRKNPSGLRGAFQEAVTGIGPKLANKFAVAAVVRRFGTPWGTGIMGQATTSPYAGQGWSLWNYVLAAGTSYFGGMMLDRVFPGKGYGRIFTSSGYDDLVMRLVWTEIVARSPTAVQYFGNMMEFSPGYQAVGWQDDPYGNRFAVLPGTNYQPAMLGLQPAGPMDGLVAAGPLDGIERANALDQRNPRRPAAPMGHYSDPWLQRGGKDPYRAAFM